MNRTRKTKILTGCPICGSNAKAVVSGFHFCMNCKHRYGSGGLGRETERRHENGEMYNVADHRFGVTRLPGADDQVRTPQRRGRPYRTELKELK